MKAAQLKDYGPAENFRITDVPKPKVEPGEVLVRVNYAGLRWGDIMGRNGVPVRAVQPPFVPGQEAAGVVAELGEGVTHVKVGDRVVVLPGAGAYAEYLKVPARARIAKVPDGVPLSTALVYCVNMPTAYLITHEWAKVQEGESVLVHAAAGGVGMLIVQILKRKFKDVKVIGLAGTDEKCRAVVEQHGADHAINSQTHDYVAEVEKIMGAKPRVFAPGAPLAGVHVVLNGVGGNTVLKDRLIIRRLGRWVLFGGSSGAYEPVQLGSHAYDSITIMPFSMIPFMGTPTYERAVAFTNDWMMTQELTPPTVHPLDDIVQIQLAMEQRKTQGKVVFSVSPE
jgi:NADPH2:quinone reductase